MRSLISQNTKQDKMRINRIWLDISYELIVNRLPLKKGEEKYLESCEFQRCSRNMYVSMQVCLNINIKKIVMKYFCLLNKLQYSLFFRSELRDCRLEKQQMRK